MNKIKNQIEPPRRQEKQVQNRTKNQTLSNRRDTERTKITDGNTSQGKSFIENSCI
jgi:hypothetical protein